ncbi:MAG TPA: hypothetical protein VHQ03_07020, partial [Candidatus Dormibacteraeota bacterium]|nr:hypothetical protein [Candidatus Dormibacteraeota bacterium]
MSVDWAQTYTELDAADRRAPLGPEDLLRLAEAAMLSGEDARVVELLQRTHNAFLDAGDPERAAEAALRLAMFLLNTGQAAQA